MARQAIIQSEPPDDGRERDAALRPQWLREIIGQKAVVPGCAEQVEISS